ncbi:lysophospholipase L1-like esterase [Friedmanniella endophytica]|uniref:Lysophospholipase L1-like esterase n=1 Tax=Microlunatus kandeliicorticis TaxID=1759536 RepID=A0A7W3P7I5_9ACTN|nr:GDSL-type esterase/lipase family protein [Microlunatus kandeliicorticis]MBA8796020.1 lysophospholipase L1-like esterase [Microlunatus kandeliicorticis]
MPELITVPLTDDLFHGAVELERVDDAVVPHRLPARARAQVDDPQLAMAESQPSGVRLVVDTEATVLELVTRPTKIVYVGAPARPDGVYDLLLDGVLHTRATAAGGRTLRIDFSDGSFTPVDGPPAVVRFAGLPAGDKRVEVWLPHTEATQVLGLRCDAPVRAATSTRPVWVHHGSSISHGSNADSPTGTWPALAAAAGGVELVNLGFGGSALLDPFTARAIRDLPADLISVKLGINLVNADLFRRRALGPAVHGFLDTIRDGHPDTPLLVVSALLCPIQEDTPGPLAPDFSAAAEGVVRFVPTGDPAEVTDAPTGRLSLRVIRAELARIVAERAATDPALHYLDGTTLYGAADVDTHPLPDALHPDAATHRLIAERFAAHAFAPGGPFAAPTSAP